MKQNFDVKILNKINNIEIFDQLKDPYITNIDYVKC